MDRQGDHRGPSVAAAAFRYGAGDPVAPPPALAIWIVAREFGLAPWDVAEAPLSDVLETLAILGAVRKGE